LAFFLIAEVADFARIVPRSASDLGEESKGSARQPSELCTGHIRPRFLLDGWRRRRIYLDWANFRILGAL